MTAQYTADMARRQRTVLTRTLLPAALAVLLSHRADVVSTAGCGSLCLHTSSAFLSVPSWFGCDLASSANIVFICGYTLPSSPDSPVFKILWIHYPANGLFPKTTTTPPHHPNPNTSTPTRSHYPFPHNRLCPKRCDRVPRSNRGVFRLPWRPRRGPARARGRERGPLGGRGYAIDLAPSPP